MLDSLPLPAAWPIAIALVALPLVAGARLGRHLRARAGGPAPRAIPIALALLLAPLALGPLFPIVSIYDLFLVAILAAAALVWTGWLRRAPVPRAKLALAAITTLVCFGAAELALRLRPAPVPSWGQFDGIHLIFPKERRDHGCPALFPDDYARGWFRGLGPGALPERPPGTRRIAHFGDSMLGVGDVPKGSEFAALLTEMRPGEEHLNLGISNTGTDAEWLVVQKWLPRLRPDEVVLHLFPGNDVGEISRAYACCDDGPLLELDEGGAHARCPTARWRVSRERLFSQGPPPFPLRLLALHSELFRGLVYLFHAATFQTVPIGNSDHDEQWALFRAALYGIRDEVARAGLPLTVVVLPSRMAFDGTGNEFDLEARATHDRMLAIAREGNIRALDAWPVFEEAFQRDPAAGRLLFKSQWSNSHFEPPGHALYARWLSDHLWPR